MMLYRRAELACLGAVGSFAVVTLVAGVAQQICGVYFLKQTEAVTAAAVTIATGAWTVSAALAVVLLCVVGPRPRTASQLQLVLLTTIVCGNVVNIVVTELGDFGALLGNKILLAENVSTVVKVHWIYFCSACTSLLAGFVGVQWVVCMQLNLDRYAPRRASWATPKSTSSTVCATFEPTPMRQKTPEEWVGGARGPLMSWVYRSTSSDAPAAETRLDDSLPEETSHEPPATSAPAGGTISKSSSFATSASLAATVDVYPVGEGVTPSSGLSREGSASPSQLPRTLSLLSSIYGPQQRRQQQLERVQRERERRRPPAVGGGAQPRSFSWLDVRARKASGAGDDRPASFSSLLVPVRSPTIPDQQESFPLPPASPPPLPEVSLPPSPQLPAHQPPVSPQLSAHQPPVSPQLSVRQPPVSSELSAHQPPVSPQLAAHPSAVTPQLSSRQPPVSPRLADTIGRLKSALSRMSAESGYTASGELETALLMLEQLEISPDPAEVRPDDRRVDRPGSAASTASSSGYCSPEGGTAELAATRAAAAAAAVQSDHWSGYQRRSVVEIVDILERHVPLSPRPGNTVRRPTIPPPPPPPPKPAAVRPTSPALHAVPECSSLEPAYGKITKTEDSEC